MSEKKINDSVRDITPLMLLLNDALMNKSTLTELEQATLSSFMQDAIGNMDIFAAIQTHASQFEQSAVKANTIGMVMDLAFFARHLAEFSARLPDITISYQKIEHGGSLNEKEKISLREYAILKTLAALLPAISQLKKRNLIADESALVNLQKQVAVCHEIVSGLDSKYHKFAAEGIFDHFHLHDKAHGKVLSEFYYLRSTFITEPQLDESLQLKK